MEPLPAASVGHPAADIRAEQIEALRESIREHTVPASRLDLLKPHPRNSRVHPPAQLDEIERSMLQWGWTMPILADEDGTILAGHGRQTVALRLGLVEVPVICAHGWSDEQKRAYIIADNKLPENAEWDPDMLKLELQELTDAGFDLNLTGFSTVEVSGLLDIDINAQLGGDPDAVPDAPKNPISKTGYIWQLGRHRLICGDCRDADTITRLLDGAKINLAFTSPPYAEQREYDQSSGFKPVPPDEYVEWFSDVAANVAANLAADGSWFVNIKPNASGLDTSLYVMDLVIAHVREWGWHFATEFCWERNGVPTSVTQRFKNQFEPIYQFVLGRWKMRPDDVRHQSDNVPRSRGVKAGDRKRATGTKTGGSENQGKNWSPGKHIGEGLAYPGNRLPTFSQSHSALGHAAAFPVGLPEFFCKAYTDPGDVVFDPFCGSGSTIIAAEITGRRGMGSEISPAYCDIIVARWENYTGQKATLVK